MIFGHAGPTLAYTRNTVYCIARMQSRSSFWKRSALCRKLSPSKILHILVLILSWPHDLASPQSLNMSHSSDQPHDDQEYRQSAAYSIDTRAVQRTAYLDGS